MRTNLASIRASWVSEEVVGSSVSNAGGCLAALLAASSAYSVLHGGVGDATTRWCCVNFYLKKPVLVASFKQIIAMRIEGDGVFTR